MRVQLKIIKHSYSDLMKGFLAGEESKEVLQETDLKKQTNY